MQCVIPVHVHNYKFPKLKLNCKLHICIFSDIHFQVPINELLCIVDEDSCRGDYNGGCSHTCRQTPFGATCFCPEGMELNDTKVCIGE